MSGTHVFYNGILMRDCETEQFSQVIEYDESGTDAMYSRIRITVSSTLVSLHSTDPNLPLPVISPIDTPQSRANLALQHPSTIAMPPIGNETSVARLREIHARLQEPRQDFWMALHATTNNPYETQSQEPTNPQNDIFSNDSYRFVIVVTGKTSGFVSGPISATNIERDNVLDANNGPKPQNVDVVKIFGGRSMRVTATFEICRCLCRQEDPNNHVTEGPPARDAAKVKGVISNRWSITDSIDEDWSTTHAIEGALVVADHRYKANAMRLMVSPFLFPFAKLSHREFVVDRTGLTLKYRMSMKETGASPPRGLVDWSGRYSETSKLGNGQHLGEVVVRLRGTVKPPDGMTEQDQKQCMLTTGLRIFGSRLTAVNQFWNQLPGQIPKGATLLDATVIEQMGKPEIEMRASVRYSDADLRPWNLRLNNMGLLLQIPNYDPKWWPIPAVFQWDTKSSDVNNGSYFDGYFQNPCSEWHAMPRGSSVPFDIVARDQPAVDQNHFYAYLGSDLAAAKIELAPLPIISSRHGLSSAQLSGFTYLSVDESNDYANSHGVMHLPLSKARAPTSVGSVAGATSVAIKVHAGISRRVFTAIAKRQGAWPKVPLPEEVITGAGPTESLLDEHLVFVTPRLDEDNSTMLYELQVRWTVGLERIPGKVPGSGDFWKVPANPIVRVASGTTNDIKVDDYKSGASPYNV